MLPPFCVVGLLETLRAPVGGSACSTSGYFFMFCGEEPGVLIRPLSRYRVEQHALMFQGMQRPGPINFGSRYTRECSRSDASLSHPPLACGPAVAAR